MDILRASACVYIIHISGCSGNPETWHRSMECIMAGKNVGLLQPLLSKYIVCSSV